MKAAYIPTFTTSGYYHTLTIYEDWTPERGLFNEVKTFSNKRKAAILKEAKEWLSFPQFEKINHCATYRERGSYNEHGIPIR